MPRLVAFVGGECTGKSTLATALAEVLPGTVVPEALREWCLQHGRTPQREEQGEIVALQIAGEDSARSTRAEWILCDAATLMTAIYSQLYFADDSLLDDALRHADQAYDCIIWCDRDVPWSADAHLRDGSEWRDRAHESLHEALARVGIPVYLASGSLDIRVESSLTFLRGLSAD